MKRFSAIAFCLLPACNISGQTLDVRVENRNSLSVTSSPSEGTQAPQASADRKLRLHLQANYIPQTKTATFGVGIKVNCQIIKI